MSKHIVMAIAYESLTIKRTGAGTLIIHTNNSPDEFIEITDAGAVELIRNLPEFIDRLSLPTKTYDHDARPSDDPEPGNRCKDCGDDITWMGPSQYDWMHVDDPRNREPEDDMSPVEFFHGREE